MNFPVDHIDHNHIDHNFSQRISQQAHRLSVISIDPMRPVDIEAVTRIDRRCFPAPWLPDSYLTELSNRAACYIVARHGQEIVGYGGVWVVMGEAHITTIAVDPDWQGHKIGERMLMALLEDAILRGASHATLEVRESNHIAQRLYCKYGFREASIRKKYYTDNDENAIVMWAVEIDTLEYAQILRKLRAALYPSN